MGYVSRYGRGTPAAPGVIIPPASAVAAAVATWPVANTMICNRFTVQAPTAVRYMNYRIGVSSGNIQFGIVSLAPNGNAAQQTAVLVASSGVIACPTGNADYHGDLGATVYLAPGDYGAFFWADNTTMSTPNAAVAGFTAARSSFSSASLASGVTGTNTASVTTRWVSGLTLESV